METAACCSGVRLTGGRNLPLDNGRPGCYTIGVKMAEKGTAPEERPREGARFAESAPAAQSGPPTTPEPPAETPPGGVDRDGSSRYRGHERRPAGRKQGGTVEPDEIAASPLNVGQG